MMINPTIHIPTRIPPVRPIPIPRVPFPRIPPIHRIPRLPPVAGPLGPVLSLAGGLAVALAGALCASRKGK